MDSSAGSSNGGGGGGGIDFSGSACAGGAASVNAAITPSAPVATDNAQASSYFLTDAPFVLGRCYWVLLS